MFLANAMEHAEIQGEDALDHVVLERQTNAETIKLLKESVKRFYHFFKITDCK